MVDYPKFTRAQYLGGKYPIRTCVIGIHILKQLCDAQVGQLELKYIAGVGHLINNNRRKDISRMDVLMNHFV